MGCIRFWHSEARKALLSQLKDAGFGEEILKEIQKLIDAENSDLFDVLQYVAFAKTDSAPD
jgi:type I restriction enzyme R subunit